MENTGEHSDYRTHCIGELNPSLKEKFIPEVLSHLCCKFWTSQRKKQLQRKELILLHCLPESTKGTDYSHATKITGRNNLHGVFKFTYRNCASQRHAIQTYLYPNTAG